MKSKTIRKVLKAKLEDWVSSIKDHQVRKLAEANTIVTGGSIASMLLKEQVKDFDIYFRDKETARAVAEYYVKEFNERNKNKKNRLGGSAKAYVLDGERDLIQVGNDMVLHKNSALYQEFANQGQVVTRMIAGCKPDRVKIIVRSDGVAAENPEVLNESFEDVFDVLDQADQVTEKVLENEVPEDRYRPIFLSSNAITLSNRVQIVVRFYGEPDVIHENYDFAHCTNYYDFGKNQLVLKPIALESLLSKELIYQGSKYPLCSIIRTRKFIQRGFTVNAGQYLKMCFQLNQLDLTNIDTLEDQLVGVDSAYFMQLISALRSKAEKDPTFTVEESYVASIIDRIF